MKKYHTFKYLKKNAAIRVIVITDGENVFAVGADLTSPWLQHRFRLQLTLLQTAAV